MYSYYPLIVVGAVIGILSILFIVAYALIKDKKTEMGFDRHIKDSELISRLLVYAKPHIGSFIIAGVVMLVSIAYDIVSPILVGYIQEMIKYDFPLLIGQQVNGKLLRMQLR